MQRACSRIAAVFAPMRSSQGGRFADAVAGYLLLAVAADRKLPYMPSFYAPIPILRIYDEAKALEFYVQFLGFSVDWRVGGGDTPVYMQVSLGACRLQLSEHFGDGTPGAIVKIKTDGLEEYQQSLLAKAYRHSRPGILVQTWGEREMTIPDPFNNKISFWDDAKPSA